MFIVFIAISVFFSLLELHLVFHKSIQEFPTFSCEEDVVSTMVRDNLFYFGIRFRRLTFHDSLPSSYHAMTSTSACKY